MCGPADALDHSFPGEAAKFVLLKSWILSLCVLSSSRDESHALGNRFTLLAAMSLCHRLGTGPRCGKAPTSIGLSDVDCPGFGLFVHRLYSQSSRRLVTLQSCGPGQRRVGDLVLPSVHRFSKKYKLGRRTITVVLGGSSYVSSLTYYLR